MLKRPKDPEKYPAYLRKIGEHAIAEHMEGMVNPVRCKDCVYKSVPKCCPYQINGFTVTPEWYCPMGVKVPEVEE